MVSDLLRRMIQALYAFGWVVPRICLTLALSLTLFQGKTQNAPASTEAINEFATILKNQPQAQPLEILDLSEIHIQIYWIYPDRRASRIFLNRIVDYVGDQRVSIVYHWEWPESIPSSDQDIPIIIYDSQMETPAWFPGTGGYKIRIGGNTGATPGTLYLPHAGTESMDLAAQFIMNGIKLDNSGQISTGTRVSYLSAGYFGLDEDYLTHQLDSILQLGLDSNAYPGAMVSIAYKGSVIYQKAIGYHTYEDTYLVRNHDLFDLASVTKITAGVNALMFLYDDEKFNLHKNLEDYFPYFKNTNKGELGLIRILTHSAGLTPYLVYYSMAQKDNGKYRRNTLARTNYGDYHYAVTDSIFVSDRFSDFIYRAIKDTPIKPGHNYEYSGLFFLLIPDLIEEMEGMPLDRYLEKSLFDPLGAHHTAFNPAHTYPINQIIPTEVDQVWRNQLVHGGVHDEAAAVLGGVSTNAGLFSTGPDLIKIAETWRRGGEFGGKRYWSEETIQVFTQCYFCDEGNRRALGFDRPPLPDHDYVSYMSPLASQQSYGHSGFTGTMLWVDPAVDYSFVFLSNRVHPTRENSKLYSLNIRPALHSVLYQALERSK